MAFKKYKGTIMYDLITSIKQETQHIENLVENCSAAPIKTMLLYEAADKAIGRAIGALNAEKNPFENDPNFRDLIAGLMLLAKNTNREALNVNRKKFDLIAQYASEREDVQEYVAKFGRNNGQSLIKNLDAYVVDRKRRPVLIMKLIQHQTEWSKAKHKANQGQEVRQSLKVTHDNSNNQRHRSASSA